MASRAIVDILECPVCLNPPESTPIFQCNANGHVVCKVCVSFLGRTCPVCRSNSGFGRCLTAERLLSLFSPSVGTKDSGVKARRLCDFASRGCTAFFTHEHQFSCQYRDIFCPDITCQKEVQLNTLVTDHLKSEHPEVMVKPGNTVMTFRLCVREEHLTVTTSYKPARFVQSGLNFFREIRRDDARKTWYFWVYFDGTKAQASSYIAEVQLLNDKKEAVITHRDDVVPLDVAVPQVVMEFRGLVLPDEFMRRKIIKNEEFYLLLSVTKRRD